MEPIVVDHVRRVPMSLEEFLALPEGTRAEYSNGVAIMTPPVSMPHNEIGLRVALLLRTHLSGVHVGYEMGIAVGPRRRRQPDVAVVGRLEEAVYTEQVPHLVVEVLSPGTRSIDELEKSQEYAEAGIGQYWIIDREQRRMTVLTRAGVGWRVLAELDDESPTVEIAVGAAGVVPVDIGDLLPR